MSVFAYTPVYFLLCPACDLRTESWQQRNDEYPECHWCGHDLAGVPTSHRAPDYVTVAVYEMYQSYGGPEEGGWWYWEYDLIHGTQRSFLAEDAPQADVYKNTLLARYNSDVHPRESHENRTAVRCFAEEEAPKHLPLRRPHYC